MAAAPTIGDGLRPLVALALGGLVPLLIYNDTWTGTAVLVGVVAAYTGIRFGWTVFGPESRLMTGFFWLFMYIFGGLAPLAQLAAHRWPLGTGVSDSEVQAAAAIMLVFVIAWDVGRGFAVRAKPPRTPTRAIRPNRITAIVVFAVLAAAYEIYRIGGVGGLFTSRERLGRLIGGESLASSIAPIHGALLGVPVFIAAYLIIAGTKTGQLGPRPLQIAALIPLALLLTNPVSSSRYLLGTVVLGLTLIILQPLRPTLYRWLLLSLASALVFAFKVFDRFRYDSSTVSGTVTFDVRAQLRNGDYDAFQQAAHAVEWVQATGYHPAQLLGPPLFWLPRAVWPDKPLDTGVVLGVFKGFDFTNLSAPVPAELYVAGGSLAVALGGLLIGWGWTRMDRHLLLYGPAGFIGLLVPVLTVYQFILLRGSLLQATGRLVVIMGLLWFATSKVEEKTERPPLVSAHGTVGTQSVRSGRRVKDW
jgi:hypothetical protein